MDAFAANVNVGEHGQQAFLVCCVGILNRLQTETGRPEAAIACQQVIVGHIDGEFAVRVAAVAKEYPPM